MRIAKVVTLALFVFQLIGCASETTTTDEPETPATATTTAPKQTFAAPLPTAKANGDVVVDAPAAADAPEPSVDASAPSSSAPPPAPPPPPPPPAVDVSPKPTAACSITKDSLGFFTRTSAKSDYVAYVPASYDKSKPTRLIVGMHGCGDNALNFAKWAVNPWDTRSAQQHIGISVSGETGNNHCWSMGNDDDKVLAAVEDIAKCFWIDRTRVVIAGYSSGGELAYRVGLKHADEFAGILIENSAFDDSDSSPTSLVNNAAWKINIAHSAHTSDSVFPISRVRADWTTLRNAGFPLKSQELAGTHDGDGKEWANWLIPAAATWTH
jgi:predicted esterase